MAKKKESSIGDAINIFEDVMTRSSLSDYIHVNRTILSKSDKGYSVIIVIDQSLWNALLEKEEFKEKLKEFNISDNENIDTKIFTYGDDINNNLWIDVDLESLYAGKVVKINIDNLEYDITIHKNVIPLKLKKGEFNNIKYRVFTNDMTLALSKRFEYPLEDLGFTIIRLFKII